MKKTKITAKTTITGMALAMLSLFAAPPAHAVDGCKFLLCIAGPWTRIAECRPTVKEVLRDLAKGRPFPTCAMSGAGNSAQNLWTSEATCPAMYRRLDKDGGYASCAYMGKITVNVNGGHWSDVYWNAGGDSVTLYTDAARQSFAKNPTATPLDDQFQRDLNAWNAQYVGECKSSYGTPVFDTFGAFQRCDNPYANSGGG
ncbi:hypothetical protein L0936_19475 [Paracidovorax citrulli]|uniref:hypothetical protein n=1 Tax=Paracidovorax citrulli TaxID=80869 RepID=UPI000AFAE85D|nr:hypothetical protein [Paracidovorax citrulli]QCX13156.1 hypothetical protein APS58_p00012 [Paracidovorax citrulli]UMT93540.1 hypothetical protein FRC97_00095 [Paracidovorax citrulli]